MLIRRSNLFIAMAQESLYQLLLKVLQQIATDLVTILPRILIAILVFVIAILIIKLLHRSLSKILDFVKLDETFKRVLRIELPFSLNGILVALVDLGIILIAMFGVASLFLAPEHLDLVREILGYGARIVSVVVITILTFLLFNALIDRMTSETRMRGYVTFIVLIITTMMVIDLTNLSNPTKSALENGLSIGLAVSIGVFAVWFFFHEYFDRLLDFGESPEKEQHTKLASNADSAPVPGVEGI
jgi:hypothetical protein